MYKVYLRAPVRVSPKSASSSRAFLTMTYVALRSAVAAPSAAAFSGHSAAKASVAFGTAQATRVAFVLASVACVGAVWAV